MSQITRCPSCATTFKVVADQLRISEGWVRCGQCKEVFDASAHLLPVAPPALLPDVSLTDSRSPAAPAARKPDAPRAWGGENAPAAAGNGARADGPMGRRVSSSASEIATPPAVTIAPHGQATAEVPTAPVLDIPSPAVPAFLAARAHADTSTAAFDEEVVAPLTWRAHSAQRAASALDAAASPSITGHLSDVMSGHSAAPEVAVLNAKHGGVDLVHDPLAPAPDSLNPAGYELPAAQPIDFDDSLGAPVELDTADSVSPSAALSLPPALSPSRVPAFAQGAASQDDAHNTVVRPAAAPSPLPSVDFTPKADLSEALAMELVKDESPAAILQARPKKSVADDDETDTPEPDPEVSFVVTARRKAFWRKPAVRGALGLLLLISLLGLALQIAVQERDRIAALDVRARPLLLQLCQPLSCELAPVRQIADVVIDSSSFNKARGDSYQLALTMKSTATIPLAMPAVELTLTDAQDQPVLRRVLLPTDMAAPAELPARGEWSTSVSVIVTTGGSRVAGYRLLAFYP